jgi:hypothetical protein
LVIRCDAPTRFLYFDAVGRVYMCRLKWCPRGHY